MIFFSYQSQFSHFSLVRQIQTNHLYCPLSNRQEPMTLYLYSYEEYRGFIYRTSKNLSGVFARTEDHSPILTQNWTEDMIQFFQIEQKNTDKFNRTWRWSGTAKFLLMLFLILASIVGYAIYQNASNNKNVDWYVFTSLWDSYDSTPELGTKYFVESKTNNNYTHHFWIKIEEIKQENQYIISGRFNFEVQRT